MVKPNNSQNNSLNDSSHESPLQVGSTELKLFAEGTSDRLQPRAGWLWFLLAAAALLAGGLVIMPFDQQLSRPESMQGLPGDLRRFVRLSEIFAHGFGIGVIAIGIWLLVPNKRRFIPRVLVAAIWPAIGVQVVKGCFARYRPIRYLDELSQANYPVNIADSWLGWMPRGEWNTIYASQSFPSAHTATTWGLAIGMCWVFPKGRWLFVFLAVLASIQRVTSFAHWPSDVCFGAAMAFALTGAVMQNWGFGKWLNHFENSFTRVNAKEEPIDLASESSLPTAGFPISSFPISEFGPDQEGQEPTQSSRAA